MIKVNVVKMDEIKIGNYWSITPATNASLQFTGGNEAVMVISNQ